MDGAYASRHEKLKPCGPDNLSFFEFIRDLSRNMRKSKRSEFNAAPLHRLCTLMRKMRAQAVLKEKLEFNQELEEELEMARARTNQDVEMEATRLTFFRSYPPNLKWDDKNQLPEDHILSYAVLIKLKLKGGYRWMYLLEAVVRPPSVVIPINEKPHALILPISNCYVHNSREFRTEIGPQGSSRTFSFKGAFFAQQNGLTHVCAHAALRSSINSSSRFGRTKLTNKRINDILGIDFSSPDNTVGRFGDNEEGVKGGLTVAEIEDVAKTLNAAVHIAHFNENIDVEYDQYIYPTMESGYPVILTVEGWDIRKAQPIYHAFSVMGHTIDSDRWSPQARFGYGSFPDSEYAPVSDWCDHYVISDDNYGMFVNLPSEMVRNFLVPKKNPNLHVTTAITLLPESVTLTGFAAEQISNLSIQSLLENTKLNPSPTPWFDLIMESKDRLICRTILCRSEDYLEHLKDATKVGGGTFSKSQWKKISPLPDYVWVTEVSIPNIYEGNKHKLGDVVIEAGVTEEKLLDSESLKFIWLPGVAYFHSKGNFDLKWPLKSHVPVFRKSEISPLEW